MSIRHLAELSLKVGADTSFESLLFHSTVESLLDTLQHAEVGTYSLDEGEANVAVDFGDVAEARVLWIEASGNLEIVVGGTPGTVATLLGSGGTFPTGFSGGEAFSFSIDGVSVAGTFLDADETAQQCCNRMNAAAMLAGLGHVPFAPEGGQIRVSGVLASSAGNVDVVTANTTLGFASAAAEDDGTDASGSSAPQQLYTAGAGTVYYLATVRTSSLVISNLADDANAVRVCILGDVVT